VIPYFDIQNGEKQESYHYPEASQNQKENYQG
jgi:hypothetical protein